MVSSRIKSLSVLLISSLLLIGAIQTNAVNTQFRNQAQTEVSAQKPTSNEFTVFTTLWGMMDKALKTVQKSINSGESADSDSLEFVAITFLGELVNEYKEWKKLHKKTYGAAESDTRFNCWCKNYKYVNTHNTKGLSWKLSMNSLADLTPEEYQALQGASQPDEAELALDSVSSDPSATGDEESPLVRATASSIPDSLDWRTLGAVTSVKSQGSCGGCYAFSCAGALEGVRYIAYGILENLSEQQIIDCSDDYGNKGCSGGFMNNGFRYTRDYGIQTRANYPYLAKRGTCRDDQAAPAFYNAAHRFIDQNNFTALKEATVLRPVAVAMDASTSDFQLYDSGILGGSCGTAVTHAVLIVGYNTTANPPYWIVKNSYGTRWGENGYFLISMGSENSGKGVCGINRYPYIPLY